LEIDNVLTGAAVPHVSRLSKRGIPPAHSLRSFGDGRVTNCWRMSILVRQRLLLRC